MNDLDRKLNIKKLIVNIMEKSMNYLDRKLNITKRNWKYNGKEYEWSRYVYKAKHNKKEV